MAEQKEETWAVRIITLIKQSPLIAVCVWLGYRDMKRDAEQTKKDTEIELKNVEREKFYKEQLIHARDSKDKELELKEKELNFKYENRANKDTI